MLSKLINIKNIYILKIFEANAGLRIREHQRLGVYVED